MSKDLFSGPTVQLKGMLEARETRANRQHYLLKREPEKTLLSMTLNIPGPIKTSLAIQTITAEVVAELNCLFPTNQQKTMSLLNVMTGPEYYQLIDQKYLDVKKQLVSFEENHPYGRLLDLDVLVWDQDTKRPTNVSRSDLGFPPRTCFICNQEAKVCSRERHHTVSEMQTAICQLIEKGLK